MLRNNFLRARLQRKEKVIGTWLTVPSAIHAEIVALSGLDFVIIDREHGSISFETATQMVIACENHGVSPLIRVSDISRSEIQRALDAGAHGVQIPNVQTVEQLKAVIEMTKYPPLGTRGFSPFTRCSNYNSANSKKQIIEGNKAPLISVHVEGIDAIRQLDLFLGFPEIDIYFVGLYDLSKSIGKPGLVDDPEVIDLLKICVEKISQSGKIPGTIANSEENLKKFTELGILYLTYSVDCEVVRDAYSHISARFKDFGVAKERCAWN